MDMGVEKQWGLKCKQSMYFHFRICCNKGCYVGFSVFTSLDRVENKTVWHRAAD